MRSGVSISIVFRCQDGDLPHAIETEKRFVAGNGVDNPGGLSLSGAIYAIRKQGWAVSGSYAKGFRARCPEHKGGRRVD